MEVKKLRFSLYSTPDRSLIIFTSSLSNNGLVQRVISAHHCIHNPEYSRFRLLRFRPSCHTKTKVNKRFNDIKRVFCIKNRDDTPVGYLIIYRNCLNVYMQLLMVNRKVILFSVVIIRVITSKLNC